MRFRIFFSIRFGGGSPRTNFSKFPDQFKTNSKPFFRNVGSEIVWCKKCWFRNSVSSKSSSENQLQNIQESSKPNPANANRDVQQQKINAQSNMTNAWRCQMLLECENIALCCCIKRLQVRVAQSTLGPEPAPPLPAPPHTGDGSDDGFSRAHD